MRALRRPIRRAFVAAAFAIAALAPVGACADGPLPATPSKAPDARMSEAAPHAADDRAPPGTRRFTVLVGVVSLPRPLAIEALVRIGDRVEVGLSAGALPAVTLQAPYRLSWQAVDAEGRFHPARGASALFGDSFFVALNVGCQSVTATNPAYFGSRIAYTTYGLFFAPRVGWAWTLRSGLAIGVDVGLAIPVLPATSVAPADAASVNTRKVSHTFGQNPMPYLNLFRLGYSF
jgi:hypothetical protein